MTWTYISSRLDNRKTTTNHNKDNISNTDDIQLCVTPKTNYSVQATYEPTHLTPSNYTLTIASIKLHTTTILPPNGKEYLFLKISGKSSQTAKCVKSRIMTKVINYILSIDTFEQQCVVSKCMLQSPLLEDHMKTIIIKQ